MSYALLRNVTRRGKHIAEEVRGEAASDVAARLRRRMFPLGKDEEELVEPSAAVWRMGLVVFLLHQDPCRLA